MGGLSRETDPPLGCVIGVLAYTIDREAVWGHIWDTVDILTNPQEICDTPEDADNLIDFVDTIAEIVKTAYGFTDDMIDLLVSVNDAPFHEGNRDLRKFNLRQAIKYIARVDKTKRKRIDSEKFASDWLAYPTAAEE